MHKFLLNLKTFPEHIFGWFFHAPFSKLLIMGARERLLIGPTVGNRSDYRGNRSYRSGSVRKKLSYRFLTEPSIP
jgi:hypothetical protein